MKLDGGPRLAAMLNARWWMLDTGHWPLFTGYSLLWKRKIIEL
jgi:hypothetical protein